MFPQVLAFAARDFDCIPGFQQKIFYIEQPLEFLEDQLVLNGRNLLVDFYWGAPGKGAHNHFYLQLYGTYELFSFIRVCMVRTLAIQFIFEVAAMTKQFFGGFGGQFRAFCKFVFLLSLTFHLISCPADGASIVPDG